MQVISYKNLSQIYLRVPKKKNPLQEINQDLIAIFNSVLAKVVIQEYIRVTKNIENEVLVAAYQGLENRYTLVYYAVKAKIVVDKA